MHYTSITLSGPVASGTTTAARALAQKFSLEMRSAGDFFRKYMPEHNIPLTNKEEVPDDIERQVDNELKDLAASEKPVVIEGLYIGYFTKDMPHVLRVLVTCDEKERAKRAMARSNETAEEVKKRDLAHDLKFRKLYAAENFLDPKFFDLIVDTTNTTPKEVVAQISQKFRPQ